MALDGLDKIPWRRLSTSYGSAWEAPHYLRLFYSPHKKDRESAVEYMVGEVNHQGHIHDSTAAVTPFLVNLLADENVPNREEILGILYAFASSVDEIIDAIGSMTYFGTVATLYNNLLIGLPIYESFLTHISEDTRRETVMLIRTLAHKSARTRVRLWSAFRDEQIALIRTEILEALVNALPGDWYPNKRLLKAYQNCFENLASSDTDERVRGMAAVGWIYCERYRLLFTQTLIKPPNHIIQALVLSLKDTYGIASKCIESLLVVDDEILQHLFAEADISAENLHIFARQLLNSEFTPINRVNGLSYVPRKPYKHWDFYRESDAPLSEQVIYRFNNDESVTRNHRDLHTDKKAHLLKVIVERDRFWEIPTNLFSFFFGLPDDREALRKLIQQA